MSTFNDLLHSLKEFCDEKDEEIKRLNNRIGGLENQYKSIRSAFLKGHYEQLKWYFGND